MCKNRLLSFLFFIFISLNIYADKVLLVGNIEVKKEFADEVLYNLFKLNENYPGTDFILFIALMQSDANLKFRCSLYFSSELLNLNINKNNLNKLVIDGFLKKYYLEQNFINFSQDFKNIFLDYFVYQNSHFICLSHKFVKGQTYTNVFIDSHAELD